MAIVTDLWGLLLERLLWGELVSGQSEWEISDERGCCIVSQLDDVND